MPGAAVEIMIMASATVTSGAATPGKPRWLGATRGLAAGTGRACAS
jgi:hypothetical protein